MQHSWGVLPVPASPGMHDAAAHCRGLLVTRLSCLALAGMTAAMVAKYRPAMPIMTLVRAALCTLCMT